MKTRFIADDSEAIASRLKEIEAENAAKLNTPDEPAKEPESAWSNGGMGEYVG